MKTRSNIAMNARRRGLVAGAMLCVAFCGSATGSVVWTGNGAGNWSDASRWDGGAVPKPFDAVVLENGANLVIDEDALLKQGGLIEDWTVDGAWRLWGDTWDKNQGYTEHKAHMRADGVLVLTDDAGRQRNYASITNRSFGIEDTFEARFTYSASLLGRYSGEMRTEGFACYFGLHGSHYDTSHIFSVPENAYGFSLKIWSTGGFSWIYNTERPTSAQVSGTAMDIDVTQPIDMIVRFDKGLLTVTMRQGNIVWSDSKDISAGFADGRHRYFIMSAGTGTNPYYAYQTISNFEARALFCGNVSHDGYLPFGTDKWQVNNSGSVAIVGENEIMMKKVTAAQGSIVCKKKLPVKRAFTVEFVERLSNVGTWAEGMSVVLQPDRLSPGFSADRFSVEPVSADRGVSFGHKWWNPAFRWCKGKTYTTSVNSPNGIGKLTDTDYLFSFQHDGFGNLRATVRAAGNTYIDNQEYSYIPGWDGGMYLGFIFGAITSDSLECHVKSPRILFADYGTETLADKLVVDGGASATLSVATVAEDDTVPMVRFPSVSLGSGCSLSVAPTNGNVALSFENVGVGGVASLAMQNGARALVGAIDFTGAAAGGLSVLGDVSFGRTLAITIPDEWKSQRVCACLIDGTELAGNLPDIADISISMSDGTVLPGGEVLRSANGKLTVNFQRGLIIFFR